MGLLGDIGDPEKDVAALKPLADHLLDRLFSAMLDLLDGFTVTITITKKDNTTK